MASRDENSVRYKAYDVTPAREARNDSVHGSTTTAKSPQQPAARSSYLPNQNKGTRSEFEDLSLTSDLLEQSQFAEVVHQPLVHKENELNECVYQLAYEALVEVSREIGREQNVRPYNILPFETLREISIKLPTTEAEMLKIDEVTKMIFDKFGHRYLKVTKEYKNILEEQRRMQNEVGLFDDLNDLDDENGDHNEAIDSDAIQAADRASTSGVRRADCSRADSPKGRKEKRRAGSPEGRKEKRRAVSSEISSEISSSVSSSEISSSVSSNECSFVVSSERSSESSEFEVDMETDDAVRSDYWLRSKAADELVDDEGQSSRSLRNSSDSHLQDEDVYAVDVLNSSKIYRARSDEVEVQITMLNTPLDAGQKSEWAAACKKLVDQLIHKIINE